MLLFPCGSEVPHGLTHEHIKKGRPMTQLLLLPVSESVRRCTPNGERGTGNGERGTGNGERGTGNGERGTGWA